MNCIILRVTTFLPAMSMAQQLVSRAQYMTDHVKVSPAALDCKKEWSQ